MRHVWHVATITDYADDPDFDPKVTVTMSLLTRGQLFVTSADSDSFQLPEAQVVQSSCIV